jgi:peptide/nickel transport system substrate-binding protein
MVIFLKEGIKMKKKISYIGLIVLTGAMIVSMQIGAVQETTAGGCPAVTVANNHGVKGIVPQQFELVEFEKLTKCKLSFAGNPDIAKMNEEIAGNPPLKQVKDRLPAEPLIWAPYQEIGKYGGTVRGQSNATEAGTAEMLSIRHVNFVRYLDDLKTIVPNVAKGWTWNKDYTVLTVKLRKGHKWSDGQPFTSADVLFWYNDVVLNNEIFKKTPSNWLFDGKPVAMEAPDETTVIMKFSKPTPGLINRLAVHNGQTFLPKHFLSRFHIKYNPQADELAKQKGLKSWAELFAKYYKLSDWKDVPSPLLDNFDKVVMPTLESHILVEETSNGRVLVANPYFHIVDTAGNQLPYINKIDERYVPDKEIRNLKIANGEVDFKQQSLFLDDFPFYKENEKKGNYRVDMVPTISQMIYYSFNVTSKDLNKRQVFSDVRFRQAMSVALDRNEIKEVVYLGQGRPEQALPADPLSCPFVTEKQRSAFIQHDTKLANKLLDEMKLVDKNGDGLRDFSDGSPLVIRLQYANQGGPIKIHELAASYWRQIGIRVDLKEVTTNEYRTMVSNNEADISSWYNINTTSVRLSEEPQQFFPPFGGTTNPGIGYPWAAWKATQGKEGLEPPADVKKLFTLAEKFIQVPLGSKESNAIGKEVVDIHSRNLWKIGIIGDVRSPIIIHNRLGNVIKLTAWSTDHYRTYPFRAAQWYIKQ